MSSLLRFGFLLLLWNIYSNCGVTAVVSKWIERPDPIVDTQDQLLKAQIEINSISTADSLEEIKDRLTTLEEQFKKLNELSDIRRTQGNESYDIVIAMQMLANHYSSIDSQLKTLQKSVNERAQLQDQKEAIKDIVEAIKSKRFKLANEKLIQLGDNTLISKIIEEVYSPENVDIVVKFAKSLSKITPTYEVLKSLYNEMKANDNQNAVKLIEIAEAIQSEVISQQSDPDEVKVEAGAMIDELADVIRVTATKFLVEAMLKACDYKTRADVHTLAGALHVFRADVSDQVMQALIDDTYGKVPTDTILENLSSHSITAQAISGVNSLFWKLKNDGKINSAAVLNLASTLSKLQNRSEFNSLDEDRQDAIDMVIESIPTCARNLFFNSTSVCLWNKAKDSYLIAAESKLNYDPERRNVFTYSSPSNASRLEEISKGATWLVEKVDNKILFKSSKYRNEFLYVAAFDYDPENRYVFSWIPGHNRDIQSGFSIELDGEYCRLKSTYSDEYLFASDSKYKHDKNYSYVFTWKPGTSGGISDFVWQIRSC